MCQEITDWTFCRSCQQEAQPVDVEKRTCEDLDRSNEKRKQQQRTKGGQKFLLRWNVDCAQPLVKTEHVFWVDEDECQYCGAWMKVLGGGA